VTRQETPAGDVISVEGLCMRYRAKDVLRDVSLPLLGLTAVSGIFYPVTAMPGWLQGTAQVFPVYWLGLGMRSGLLSPSAAAVEIAASWRVPQTAAVLGAWVLAGLVTAPLVLRRMARRESGSRVAQRRDRALQRTG
jgi:ABC-2 type transport system permease protein